MVRRIKMFIGKLIWDICEYYMIDLGDNAPIAFGYMIGVKKKEKLNDK